MLFFFGTRASKIKERKIRKTTCPYCQTQDSFNISTFSKYFHFFWIPIIPLFKTNIAECEHCKKSYAQHEFTSEMNMALQRENETNPAKRPIWKGCGCLILVGFFSLMFAISLYGVYMRSDENALETPEKDHRKVLLDTD
ncbi:MAG: zinc-ribbon domain-containing protein, partial [Maribacter sp.]